jgi:hypothetical protein
MLAKESGQDLNKALNRLLMRVTRRAEKATPDYLARTFVPVDPIPSLLESLDNQVIYGRRGTGKTHLLKYLAETKKEEDDVALYVDLRMIGSSGGLYADTSEPIGLRATNLLVDLIEELHSQIRELVENTATFDKMLDRIIPSLDDIGFAATQVRVVGDTENSVTISAAAELDRESSISVGFNGSQPSVTASASNRRKSSSQLTKSRKQSGQETLTVRFGMLGRALSSLLQAMDGRRLWLLLDEWSSIPSELQPYLADLLRRCFFPVTGVSVKIGALERQSHFIETIGQGTEYIGIDLGADTAASLDLDDFLVFRADRSHALTFFSQLLHRHLVVLTSELGYEFQIKTSAEFREISFTGQAFDELVKAAEGVPRDALNIAGLAAAIAVDKPIAVRNIQVAAREYFLRDKEGKISGKAQTLLNTIVRDCVERETRVLVLRRPRESNNYLVQILYDHRLIHRIEQGVMMGDDYSVKYDLYLVDFGCFVNMLSRGDVRAVNDGTDTVSRRLLDGSRSMENLRSGSVIQLPVGPRRARAPRTSPASLLVACGPFLAHGTRQRHEYGLARPGGNGLGPHCADTASSHARPRVARGRPRPGAGAARRRLGRWGSGGSRGGRWPAGRAGGRFVPWGGRRRCGRR